MAPKTPVSTDKALQLPLFSQAIICAGMVYCSGTIGIDASTMKVVDGSVTDRTRQALRNLQVVLEEAGSSLQNMVKCNIYLTNMEDFAAMNKGYVEMIQDPKPARTCVGVKELPFKTDVEIECIAHL